MGTDAQSAVFVLSRGIWLSSAVPVRRFPSQTALEDTAFYHNEMGEIHVSSNYHPEPTHKRYRSKPRIHLAPSHSLQGSNGCFVGETGMVFYHE